MSNSWMLIQDAVRSGLVWWFLSIKRRWVHARYSAIGKWPSIFYTPGISITKALWLEFLYFTPKHIFNCTLLNHSSRCVTKSHNCNIYTVGGRCLRQYTICTSLLRSINGFCMSLYYYYVD